MYHLLVSHPYNMNTGKDMAKVEGLNLRGGRYYVRIIVPGDLQQLYGKTRVNIVLGTRDRREATLRGLVKRAEWIADFDAKRRQLKPEPMAVITPELAQELALRIHALALRQDDTLRDDPQTLTTLAAHVKTAEMVARSRLLIGGSSALSQPPAAAAPSDDLQGLSDDAAETLAGLNTLLDERAGADLARRRRAAVLPLVRLEAAKLGVAFDPHAEGANEALMACLTAYRTGRHEVTRRDAGEVVETPAAPAASFKLAELAKPKARTLRDVFDRWKTSGDSKRSDDSIAAYDRALRQFEGKHPGNSLETITRDMGDGYRSWLREVSATPKTARDRLNAIKSLLKFGAETLECIPKQPWRGLDIKATTTNERRHWLADELRILFGQPLHTAYALPDIRYGGREAAYWIPLLGLFTGSRLGELCQLRADDVQTIEGISVLIFTDKGEGQKIKSAAGHRSVPIHSELVRLGFLTYVEAVKKAGSDSLWPTLPLRKGKPSDFFGRWFRIHCEPLNLAPTFHYFRHTVRPLMRRAGHDAGTQDKVTGHKTVGSIGTVVYDHRTLDEVQRAVEAIRYPELSLRRVAPYHPQL